MDLSFSEEQNILRDTLEKFIQDKYDISERNKLTASEEGFSRDHWQQFADLGWLALPFSEDDGGIGGTAVDTMVLMEEFGKGLVVEPYLATVIMVGTAISAAGTAEQKGSIIPAIADGSLIASFAYAEAQSHYNNHNIQTTAKQDGDTYHLTGTKSVVLNAQSADKILVTARTSGEATDTDGISLFLVDASESGISREDYPTVDGLRASEVTFTDVQIPATALVGSPGKAAPLIWQIESHTILALAAEAVGAMEILYKDTIAYTKEREQFDHPLSDFQVLKHRMTEMFMEHSLAKSLCMKATMLVSQDQAVGWEHSSDETRRTIHALKFLIGKAGRFIGENAVQLHGGMGMTEELRVAHYFKRLMVIDSQMGNRDYHLTQFTR